MLNQGWVYAVLALLCWGIWGFLPKLAVSELDPRSVMLYQALGVTAVGLVLLAVNGFPQWNQNGASYAFVTGVFGILGSLFFVRALSGEGKLSIFVTFTALYPVISVALAVFILRENLSFKQWVACGFAAASIVLFAVE
ncbi:MAG TPA: EamA family transporter [Pseudomonadales bacterium]|nr:EamA family transporter [Pseudomonadales bacterium]